MDFTNSTDFPGEALVGSTGDWEQTAMVACKVTYRMADDGSLEPVPTDQMWPVLGEPASFEGVTLLPELEFRKQGIDLLVFGQAEAPRGWASRHLTLRVQCGPVDKRIEVFGDRQWLKGIGGFMRSEAEPFETMPLTNDRAFGGPGTLAGEEVIHPFNPDGRGYCMCKEEVEGKPLPNLERPEALITDWKQAPEPACLYKPIGPLFDASGPGSFDELGQSQDPMALPRAFIRTAFNQAVPDLVCPTGELGITLSLSGFDADGDLLFPLPPEQAVPGEWGPTVHASIGELKSRFPLSVSTIVVLAPQRVLIVTYLALFRYLFRPEELRLAELRWPGATAVPAPTPRGMS
ncbi:MAG: DUF2169 domain-containing protein [Gemmatimonadota bacterium]